MPISEINPQIFEDINSDEFKQRQWKSFIEKNQLAVSSTTFLEVMQQVSLFIHPIFEFTRRGEIFQLSWQPPGPWR